MRAVGRLAVGLIALALLVAAALPAGAQARWGRAFTLAGPGTLDLLSPALAVAPSGAAAVGFSSEDVDLPGSAQAQLALRGAGGADAAPQPVPGAGEVLALAYDRSSLELLTGTEPRDGDCCSSVRAVRVGSGGHLQRPRTLVGGLAGATQASLETLADGRMLAAVATQRGVWVAQSTSANRFAGQRLLTGRGQMPETLAAAGLGGEDSIVAWTATSGVAGASAPGAIRYALGSRRSAPHAPRTAVRAQAGHRVDELGVAPQGHGEAGAAWIESWFSAGGAWRSQVRAIEIAPGSHPRTLSSIGRLASGLTFAGDAAGDQALAWESCTVDSSCTARVVVRRAGGRFGAPLTLGAVDADEAPALAVGPGGQVVVAWIDGGQPYAVSETAPDRGLGRPVRLSSSIYASGISVAAGPRRHALVAWTQGTLNPSVVGVQLH